MNMSPDEIELFRWGPIVLNATIVSTWAIMLVLAAGSWLVTRKLSPETRISRWQHVLEVVVLGMQQQIREVSRQEPGEYLPFVGTIFLFVAMSALSSVVPGFHPPTSSLSTTAALAMCVFIAVPLFGIQHQGVRNYLRQFAQPSVFMLPFNVIGELSRTLALAVRLYGNMMSGTVIAAILLAFVPLFVPVVMQLFGLLTGMIQAYIFAILAMVYIASATQAHHEEGTGDEITSSHPVSQIGNEHRQ